MKKIKIPVSYTKIHNTDGTVYKKAIRISKNMFDLFNDFLMAHKAINTDNYNVQMWCNPLQNKNGIAFTNLTQQEILLNWLTKCNDVEIDKKRVHTIANMYIMIK